MAGTKPIEFVECDDAAQWDACAERFGATVFHRLPWLRAIAGLHRADLKAYLIHTGGELAGLFPVLLYRYGPLRIAASPPPRSLAPYLGPVCAESILPDVLERLRASMRHEGVSYAELRFPTLVGGSLPPGFHAEARARQILDLAAGDEALWHNALTSPCRRAVRKAMASNATVVEGSLLEQLDAYYEMAQAVYAKSRRPPALGREGYRALGELARHGNFVKIFFVRHAGRTIAGGIFPFDARTVYYLDGVSTAASHPYRPNNLLHWEVIRWACAAGLQRYDMIGANVGGIGRFKRSFGAADVPYTYAYGSRNPVIGAARRAYARLAPALRTGLYTLAKLPRARPSTGPQADDE